MLLGENSEYQRQNVKSARDPIHNKRSTYITGIVHITGSNAAGEEFCSPKNQTTGIMFFEGFLCSSLCLKVNSYLVFIFLFSDNYILAKQLWQIITNLGVLITFINQFINLIPL